MKRLILVKLLSIVIIVMSVGCTVVSDRYAQHPELVRKDLVTAAEVLGKTLPVVLTMMNRDIAPPYTAVIMDTEVGADGKPIDKAVYPEWRLYHFDTFDALVEVGGAQDGLVLATIQK